jgi:hypothetical protein
MAQAAMMSEPIALSSLKVRVLASSLQLMNFGSMNPAVPGIHTNLCDILPA